MGDIVIVKATQHMDYSIGLADIGQEFVAETFAFACSFYQSGYIYNFHGCRDNAPGIAHLYQLSQTVVWYRYYPHIGFYGTERKVGRLGFGIG